MKESTEIKSVSPLVALFRSVVVGSATGGLEVLVDHPLWTIKIRLQTGEPFTLNPSILYRGIVPNIASMIPITALQVSIATGVQSVLTKDDEPTRMQRAASAFIGGIGSAVASCPFEMGITYLGGTKQGFMASTKLLIDTKGWGILYSGFVMTMLREGVFTVAFLAGGPILKEMMMPYVSREYVASLGGGITAGLLATFASQSADTLKTIQQKAAQEKSVTIWQAAKGLYAQNGYAGFFKGIVPRGARVVSAVTLMSEAAPRIKEMLASCVDP